MRDSLALEKIRAAMASREDVVAETVRQARGVPQAWSSLPLGRALRWVRLRFRLRQRDAALLAGMSQSQVAKIEKGGDVRLSTIEKLLKGYGFGWVLLPVCEEEVPVMARRYAKQFPKTD